MRRVDRRGSEIVLQNLPSTAMKRFCSMAGGKGNRIICYFTYYSSMAGIGCDVKLVKEFRSLTPFRWLALPRRFCLSAYELLVLTPFCKYKIFILRIYYRASVLVVPASLNLVLSCSPPRPVCGLKYTSLRQTCSEGACCLKLNSYSILKS